MPTWVQYLQALLTPAIALLALTIGIFQWRTAHQRAVLDLFDRRMQIFDELNKAVSEIVREGKADFRDVILFTQAASRARFLFGNEITSYLERIRTTIIGLRQAELQANSEDDVRRAAGADLEARHLMTITGFYEEFSDLVRPYVRMQQRAFPF